MRHCSTYQTTLKIIGCSTCSHLKIISQHITTLPPTGQAHRWTPSCLPSLKTNSFTIQMPWRHLGFERKKMRCVSGWRKTVHREWFSLSCVYVLQISSMLSDCPILPATCLAACRKGIVAEGPGCCLRSSSNVSWIRQCKPLSQRQNYWRAKKATRDDPSIVGRTQDSAWTAYSVPPGDQIWAQRLGQG